MSAKEILKKYETAVAHAVTDIAITASYPMRDKDLQGDK